MTGKFIFGIRTNFAMGKSMVVLNFKISKFFVHNNVFDLLNRKI